MTASIRFLLACIKVKESAPFYHRYIARNDLFKRVFDSFFASPADDMLKASICNLIEVITMQNSKVLVKYIAKQYGERLRVGGLGECIEGCVVMYVHLCVCVRYDPCIRV